MNFLDHIERGFKFLFKSLNFVVGIVVGAMFGALFSILVIMMVSDGFNFSGGWYWRLLPGAVLGAVAGIKIWPLMLGIFFGGDADLDLELGDNEMIDSEVKCSDDSNHNSIK